MSELNKNKQLKKLYDFGDRITPQKWSKAIDILSPYSPPTNAPVINTTYQEAKTLYESGSMQVGVYYAFEYKHSIYPTENINIYMDIDLKVFIDDKGNLKAQGIYIADEDSYTFKSDYTFKPKYLTVDGEMGIFTEYFGSHSLDIVGNPNSTDLLNILKELNVSHVDVSNDYSGTHILNLNDVALVYDHVDDRLSIYTTDGYRIKTSEYNKFISVERVNYDSTGFISNIEYHDGTFHSVFVNGIGPGGAIVINADVYNDIDNTIYSESGQITIRRGIIEKSNIVFSDYIDWGCCNIKHTTVYGEYSDRSAFNIGELYAYSNSPIHIDDGDLGTLDDIMYNF